MEENLGAGLAVQCDKQLVSLLYFTWMMPLMLLVGYAVGQGPLSIWLGTSAALGFCCAALVRQWEERPFRPVVHMAGQAHAARSDDPMPQRRRNRRGRGAHVALWGEAWPDAIQSEEPESDDDDGGAAAVAGGSMKQPKPASFHQARAGVTTRAGAARALQDAGLQSAATMLGQENTVPGQAGTSRAAAANMPTPVGSTAADGGDGEGVDITPATRLPLGGHIIIALNPNIDREFVNLLMQSGQHTAMVPTVVSMPGLNLSALLDRGHVSLQPLAAATPAVMAAIARETDQRQDAERTARLLELVKYCHPTLPFVDQKAFMLYNSLTQKPVICKLNWLLLDTGANGALIAKRKVELLQLPYEDTPGLTIAAAGSDRPAVAGILTGVQLHMLPGTQHAVSVPFDALVMEGVENTYDAIVGREQMHLLGMSLDFLTKECYIRPRLWDGSAERVRLPMHCTKARATSTMPASTDPGHMSLAASWDAGAIVRGPRLSGTAMFGAPARMAPSRMAEIEAWLDMAIATGTISPVPLIEYADDTVYATASGIVVAHNRHVDYRRLNAPVVAGAWEGSAEAHLMQSGDINPNPGPSWSVAGQDSRLWPQAMRMLLWVSLMAGVGWGSVRSVTKGAWLCASALCALAWCMAAACVPTLVHWADTAVTLTPTWVRLPRHMRRCRKKGTTSAGHVEWNPPSVRLRVRRWLGLILLLAVAVLASTAAATSAASVVINTSDMSGEGVVCWVPSESSPTWMAMVAGQVFGQGGPHPGQQLESLQPAGEPNPHEDLPERIIDPDYKFQFVIHPTEPKRFQEDLRREVRARKDAFAFSVKEMSGYQHKVGWKLNTTDPIKEPCNARRFSPAEERSLMRNARS